MRNLEDSHLEYFVITRNKSEGKGRAENLQRTVAWPGGSEEHRSEAGSSHGKVPKK